MEIDRIRDRIVLISIIILTFHLLENNLKKVDTKKKTFEILIILRNKLKLLIIKYLKIKKVNMLKFKIMINNS